MNTMKRLYLLFLLGVMMIGPDAHAANARADKKNVSLWYEAFSKKDPTLLDRILSTQRGALMGFPTKNRKMSIQAIDIHEFKEGKIVRTWHTEDWMSGLHQLGVFDK